MQFPGSSYAARLGCALLACLIGPDFALAQSPRSPQPVPGEWQSRGPGGGGAFATLAVGSNGMIVAASDLSGAYRSEDRGVHWDVIGPTQGLTATHVSGVAFDPLDPGRIYLGTDEGIFRSTDGGALFDHPLGNGFVTDLFFSSQTQGVGYAAVHPAWNSKKGQVWRSLDGGATWQRRDVDLPTNLRILEILIAPNDDDAVFILSGEGRFASGPKVVYRSLDGGVHWVRIAQGLGARVIDMALDPFDDQGLYLSIDDVDPDAPGHLYHSSDQGTTFSHLAQRGGVIWPDRLDANRLRMVELRYSFPWDSREGIWESTDGGASFTRTSSVVDWDSGWSQVFWAFTESYSGPSLSVAEDPTDPEAFFWVNSQFAYASFDRGRTVQQLFTSELFPGRWRSTGFDNVVPVALAVSPADPRDLYAAYLDLGLWCSRDGGMTWSSCNEAAYTGEWGESGGNTWTVLADPDLAGRVWAPQAQDAEGPSTLLRSDDGALTWQAVGAGLPAAPLLGLSLDAGSPLDARRLLVTGGGDVYGSSDGGLTFSALLVGQGLRFTAVDPFDGNVVYAGGEGGLWRSDAAGSPGSWQGVGTTAMRGSIPGLPWGGWEGVAWIEPDPHTPGTLYVAVSGPGGGLYRSPDRGDTWEARLLADDYLRSVEVDEIDPDTLYLASTSAFEAGGYDPASAGVRVSRDRGLTWQSMNEGLAWPFAIHVLSAGGSGRLYLASPGTGIGVRLPRR